MVKETEEPTKSTAAVSASVVPPVPAREQMKRRDADDPRAEGTNKDEDRDAMDFEQTSVHPPLGETTTSEHAKEHPAGQPESADRNDTEGDSNLH